MDRRMVLAAWLLMLGLSVVPAKAEKTPQPEGEPTLAPLRWTTDYYQAYQRAERTSRMLMVYFHSEAANTYRDKFESESLADPKVIDKLRDYVLVKLPIDTVVSIGGVETKLIEHEAFSDLGRQEGIAVIDMVNKDAEHFAHIVSVITLGAGRYYHFRPNHLAVLLDLPPGTLTQRTMIFAVRIHPEAPASTVGEIDEELMHGAKQHSHHQAQIQVQGHHNWGSRFQHLSSRLPGGLRAQEVVAESWPHQSLLDAAVDCVHSWRQSSGHWGAVRSHQPRFGYDMRRGRNGIWYATGIFGNHH